MPAINGMESYVDVNELHAAYDNTIEGLLRNITAKVEVTRKGWLKLCSHCSHAKDLWKNILSYTTNRSGKKLDMLLIDLSGIGMDMFRYHHSVTVVNILFAIDHDNAQYLINARPLLWYAKDILERK